MSRPIGFIEVNRMIDQLEEESLRGRYSPEKFESLLFQIEALLCQGRIRESNHDRALVIKQILKLIPCLTPKGKELFRELSEMLALEL